MLRQLGNRVLQSTPVVAGVKWCKTHSLPGFEGIPIFSVMRFVLAELKKDNIIIRSNAMAFSFFLALFPSIIVLITLLPYFPIDNFVDTLKESVLQLLPQQAAVYIVETIDSLTQISNRSLLSFGLFLTMFFASNGMLSMLRGFEKNYEITYRSRSSLRRRLVALQLIFIVGGIFFASIALIVFGRVVLDSLLEWAQITQGRYQLILIIRWVAIVLLFYAGISATYRFGPALKQRFTYFSPGATLATLLSILSSVLFSYYVNRFGQYNELYGSLGALIVLMLWMQINSFIILLGYELNASIRINRDLVELQNEVDESIQA